MEGGEGSQSRASRKRALFEGDVDDLLSNNKAPEAKRIRFPKGKKVKPGDDSTSRSYVPEEKGPVDLKNPKLAAKERSRRRNQMTTDLFIEDRGGNFKEIADAEIAYEDDETFDDDGIEIEPFNLENERQEGYFDADGNYVEYVNKEIKDAWLDSVEVDTKLASKISVSAAKEDDNSELSSEDIGKIKRRIADSLQPGETVLQALRRLKGNSTNRKEKMSAETKLLFDQLTEDAALLMERGEYDVYHDEQEVFEREAEGYERLARARAGETDVIPGSANSAGTDGVLGSSILNDTAVGTSNPNGTTEQVSADDTDNFDMFAEDDEDRTARPSLEGNNQVTQGSGAAPENGDSQTDYIYDDASGYYYSSSSGYYYDASTGLYCSAATGQWYSYNEEKGAYEEIPTEPVVSNVT